MSYYKFYILLKIKLLFFFFLFFLIFQFYSFIKLIIKMWVKEFFWTKLPQFSRRQSKYKKLKKNKSIKWSNEWKHASINKGFYNHNLPLKSPSIDKFFLKQRGKDEKKKIFFSKKGFSNTFYKTNYLDISWKLKRKKLIFSSYIYKLNFKLSWVNFNRNLFWKFSNWNIIGDKYFRLNKKLTSLVFQEHFFFFLSKFGLNSFYFLNFFSTINNSLPFFFKNFSSLNSLISIWIKYLFNWISFWKHFFFDLKFYSLDLIFLLLFFFLNWLKFKKKKSSKKNYLYYLLYNNFFFFKDLVNIFFFSLIKFSFLFKKLKIKNISLIFFWILQGSYFFFSKKKNKTFSLNLLKEKQIFFPSFSRDYLNFFLIDFLTNSFYIFFYQKSFFKKKLFEYFLMFFKTNFFIEPLFFDFFQNWKKDFLSLKDYFIQYLNKFILIQSSFQTHLLSLSRLNLPKFLVVSLLKNGKKKKARKLFTNFNSFFKKNYKLPGLIIFIHAILLTEPKIWIKKKKLAGKLYEIPIFIKPEWSLKIAIRWILEGARKKKKNNFIKWLSLEIIDCCFKKGFASLKKNLIHETVKKNKAYIRWI